MEKRVLVSEKTKQKAYKRVLDGLKWKGSAMLWPVMDEKGRRLVAKIEGKDLIKSIRFVEYYFDEK